MNEAEPQDKTSLNEDKIQDSLFSNENPATLTGSEEIPLKEPEDAEIDTNLITRFKHACVIGDLKTVQDILENGSLSVNELDEENLTGIHWAGLNNRYSVCKYLIEKGADLSLEGGELSATPLHFAAQRGHVYISDLMLSHGANVTAKDSLGADILQAAVLSGNVLLVIYLLNTQDQCNINTHDKNLLTPLHWASYRGDALTVDILLKHGADVTMVDNKGFTPLYWALTRPDIRIIKSLVAYGSSLHVETLEGQKDAFKIAQEMETEAILQAALKFNDQNPDGSPRKHYLTEKQAKGVTFFTPYLVLFAALNLVNFQSSLWLLNLAILAVVAFAAVKLLNVFAFPVYLRVSGPLLKSPYLAGTFSATAFWAIFTWLIRILPFTFFESFVVNLIFAAMSGLMILTFYKTLMLNPGYVPLPLEKSEIKKTIKDLLELHKYDTRHFCIKSFIRKPKRSCYSEFQRRTVARYDHFCPWVFNDIGIRNHKPFIAFSLSLQVAILCFIILTIEYFDEMKLKNEKQIKHSCSFLSEDLCKGYRGAPFTFNVLVWVTFQFIWLSMVNIVQFIQIFKGLTTEEAKNFSNPDRMNKPWENFGSVPPEFWNDGSTLDPLEVEGPDSQDSHEACQSPMERIKGGFNKCFKLVGIDQVLGMAREVVKNTHRKRYTDFGWRQNMIDFWFLRDEDEGMSMETLFRIPIKGEGNLNGKLVDYYTLWELPGENSESV
ncbi:BA75_02854T0 [Komagataella pastoris]|uniref:Palmitoyltransferase n=1 Tax=Komagataella pastoris TaxID=4922 RepID=A0A1B2JC79_PICPA|nr:BA75_02854T0 [Komagataella pastoris]